MFIDPKAFQAALSRTTSHVVIIYCWVQKEYLTTVRELHAGYNRLSGERNGAMRQTNPTQPDRNELPGESHQATLDALRRRSLARRGI